MLGLLLIAAGCGGSSSNADPSSPAAGAGSKSAAAPSSPASATRIAYPQPNRPHTEKVDSQIGVNAFANHHNASGKEVHLSHGAVVRVSCRVRDTGIGTALPGGYWYLIASGPATGLYATANSFDNGGPSYDQLVPLC